MLGGRGGKENIAKRQRAAEGKRLTAKRHSTCIRSKGVYPGAINGLTRKTDPQFQKKDMGKFLRSRRKKSPMGGRRRRVPSINSWDDLNHRDKRKWGVVISRERSREVREKGPRESA